MADDKFKRFGKYLILDHLVDGGMAKICRARFLGEQANKIVAIKMVQAQYSKDPSFVQMFEDELKVTFDLLHPNIAQVYDYGMVDEQLYSAMEYIDGANLKQFLDRLKEKKYVFPVEISTYIISQVSQALHYAHNFTDKLSGKSSNIIHRDISPHNVMLTYDGAVKVIDFGIAKADSNSEATQAGTIKGKLSYLAPEYLDGLDLDHRYDQFSVGISLWEMLCSRKLFTAKNDLAVLKQIQACKIPKPSSINPNVPAELDEIVLKALSKDRNQRYENMDKLNRALVKFLYSNYPEFNATDLGYFAKQLFTEEITSDRKKFVEFGKIDIKPYLNALASENSGQNSNSDTNESSGSFVGDEVRTGKIVLDLGDFSKTKSSIQEVDLALDVAGKTAGGVKMKNNSSTATRKIKRRTPANGEQRDKAPGTKLKRVRAVNTSKMTKIARSKVSKGKSSSAKKKGSLVPTIIAAGIAIFIFTQNDSIQKNTGVDILCTLGANCTKVIDDTPEATPSDQVSTNGSISFGNFDSRMEVFVDGKRVNVKGISFKYPIGGDHELVIKRSGFKKWIYPETISLTKVKPYLSIKIPELQEVKMGYISSSQNFTSGSVIIYTVDGENFERNLPLKNERIPAGTYDAVIANKLLQTERKIRFTVKENKKEVIR